MLNHICKTVIGEENDSFQLIIFFKEHSFDLIILQNSFAWKSQVTEEDLEITSKLLNLNVKDYYNKLIDYINATPTNVKLIKKDANFTVEEYVENLKIKYFTIILHKSDYINEVERLINKMYLINLNTLERLKEVEREKMEYEKVKCEYEQKLDKLIQLKNVENEQIYGSFLTVLNEKKMRIQHLTELLEAFKAGRPVTNPSVEVKRRKRKKTDGIPVPAIHESISSSSSDSDRTDNESNYNTDKENETDIVEQVNNDIVNPGPSTSQAIHLLIDDSPPKHCLPKRIKNDGNRTLQPRHEKRNKSKSEHYDYSNCNNAKTDDSSQTVDLNTDDLLNDLF